MANQTPGSLRQEQKEAIQLKKEDIIKKCLYLSKEYKVSVIEEETITNILIKLTHHRVGAYHERMSELEQYDLTLRGIHSNHMPKQQFVPSIVQNDNAGIFNQMAQYNQIYNDWQ